MDVTTNRHSRLEVSPGSVIAAFPGPALLTDGAGHVLAANAAAAALIAALHSGRLPQLADAIEDLAQGERPYAEKIDLTEIGGETALDVTILPLRDRDAGGAPFALILGRESTLERNFINALVASRQLFKDLVGCSSDFAWETRADGTLGFVSSRGALGYSARDLYGRLPRGMAVDGGDPGDVFPFESHVALEDVEVWLFDADGKPACLLTSCVPVIDEHGTWQGTRGVCRDVTQARERDAALERARNRERVLGAIVDAIRTQVEPARMLEEAARATADALLADHCWILRADSKGALAGIIQSVRAEESIPPEAADAATNAIEANAEEGAVAVDSAGLRILAAAARYHNALNGAICVARAVDAEPWDADTAALLEGVGDHLGIAIAQIESHEKLEELARTDELTGLLNRRAFFGDIEERLQVLTRRKRRAALFYVDLDNFKQVNDVHGHERGDEALVALSRILGQGSRIGDLVSRLGGDEFAMWLEETDETAAVHKAEALFAAATALAEYSGGPDHPLGISVGIAVTDPDSGEPLNSLIARADGAMFMIKHGSKGGYAIAEPAASVSAAGA